MKINKHFLIIFIIMNDARNPPNGYAQIVKEDLELNASDPQNDVYGYGKNPPMESYGAQPGYNPPNQYEH